MNTGSNRFFTVYIRLFDGSLLAVLLLVLLVICNAGPGFLTFGEGEILQAAEVDDVAEGRYCRL